MDRAARRAHVEAEAVERERQRARCDVGRAADRVGHRTAAGIRERGTAGIVEIDQARRIARQHLEQPPLRLEVRLHVLVEIEMIARQIGEHAGREPHAIYSAQRQGMRRYLHCARAAAAIHHLAQKSLQVGRFRRRPRRLAHIVAPRADPIRDGPQQPGSNIRCFKHGGDEIGRGGLAVRAGDSDHLHLGARMVIERRRHQRQREPRVLDDGPRHVDASRCRLLGHHGHCTTFDRLARERHAVGVQPFEGHEHLPRLDVP